MSESPVLRQSVRSGLPYRVPRFTILPEHPLPFLDAHIGQRPDNIRVTGQFVGVIARCHEDVVAPLVDDANDIITRRRSIRRRDTLEGFLNHPAIVVPQFTMDNVDSLRSTAIG